MIATQNQDSVMVYSKSSMPDKEDTKWISLKADDYCATILYKNNKTRKLEFYYGSTYLSQSTRKILMDKEVVKLTITNFKGVKREIIR